MEKIKIENGIALYASLDQVNQWGSYDVTILVSENQLVELEAACKALVAVNKFPESIPVLVDNKPIMGLDGKPVTKRGYNLPYSRISEELERSNTALQGLYQIKSSSKYKPTLWMREFGKPRKVDFGDSLEWRGAIVSIFCSISTYNKEAKGVKLYLEQVMYNGESGIEFEGGGSCAFD